MDEWFLDSPLNKSFLNQTTLKSKKEKWTFLNREFTLFNKKIRWSSVWIAKNITSVQLWKNSQLRLGLKTWVIGSINLIEIFPLSLPQKTKIATSAQPWQPWMENYNFLLFWLHCNLKRCNKTKVNILPVPGPHVLYPKLSICIRTRNQGKVKLI